MKLKPQPSVFEDNNISYRDIRRIIATPGLSVLLDTLPEGLVIADQRGTVVLINSAAESINEIDRSQILGRTLKVFCRESVLSLDQVETFFMQATGSSLLATSADNDQVLTTTRVLRGQDNNTAFYILVQYSMKMVNNLLQKCDTRRNGFSFGMGGYSEAETDFILNEEGWSRIEKGGRALKMGSRVLLTGESGTGKTFAAKMIHEKFVGKSNAFVRVNCASIPETLFESEMFGYERGAFTGAHQGGKRGLIESADGGTLFLDEVGEIPLYCQPKLLQFLEGGMVQRLGATKSKRVNVNIIAATNRDLEKMVAEGTFRKDLFYRLSVIRITTPPLRETKDIIPDLIRNFMERLINKRGKALEFSETAWSMLIEYDYPGNIRQLQNIIEHLAVECDDLVRSADLTDDIRLGRECPLMQVSAEKTYPLPEMEGEANLKELVRDFELRIINNAIKLYGSKRKAAQALGVDIATIVRKTNPDH